MKIALVSLARRGGMVHFLAELANALAPLIPTVAVVSASAELNYLSRKIRRIEVNTGRNPLHSLLQFLNPVMWTDLLKRLKAEQPDLIHIVGVHEWNPALAFLCKLLRKPLVYTVHDPEAHPSSPVAIMAGDRITARLANEVVALTWHGRAVLLSRGFPSSEISVIPHPAYSLFRRWRTRTARPGHIILHFGRIEAYKGLEVLVQAFLSVRDRLPEWKLIIAGSGPVPASIAMLAGEDITIINRYVPDKEAARLVSMASIVALPYTSATQSGVLALAQAFERPVVATAVGGLDEMIVQGKTGILVPPGNVPALARAIRSLAADRGRRVRMQHSIAAVAKTTWNPRGIARKHVSLYYRVVERRADL